MTGTPHGRIGPEMSRPFRLAELAEVPERAVEIIATDAERSALSARCGILSVDALSARLTVRKTALGEVVVAGTLQAQVVQECVVSLEPVADTIGEAIEQRYTLQPVAPAADLVTGPGDDEPPEPITGETIDIGELVAQFLSVSINPYPRAPGAEIATTGRPDGVGPEGPFAVLAKLRDSETG